MSEHNFQPGDVAVVTWRGVPNVRVIRGDGHWVSADDTDDYITDYANVGGRIVSDARPLILIDPEDDAQTDALRDVLRRHGADLNSANVYGALREFARPPRCDAALRLNGATLTCRLDAGHDNEHESDGSTVIWAEVQP